MSDSTQTTAAAATTTGAATKRVPPPSRRRSASDLTTTVAASIAIALPLMFYLRQHVEILRYGYEIESLKERRAALAERSKDLAVERAEAASLPEVERRAEALGLVAPDPRDVFVAVPDNDPIPQGSPVPVTARLE
jgi:hypothetical protein